MPRTLHGLLLVFCMFPLVACAQDSTVQVGDTEFDRLTLSVVEGQKEATAGDLNGDGVADMVVAGNGQVVILMGSRNGDMEVRARVQAGPEPVGPDLADLDGDGHIDIAVANHDTQYLTLLRGDGTGHFDAFPHSPLTVDVDPHPHAVRAADLDRDEHVDLVVDHRAGEGLLVLRGSGEGQFKSSGTLVPGGGDPYRGMAVGDVNGDDRPDLITPNPNGVGVILSEDATSLQFSRLIISTEAGPFAVDVGDLNGDGVLDIVAAQDEGSDLIRVFLGDGQGAFREADDSPFRLTPGAKQIAGGDFNADGVDDAAITGWNASEVLLLLGGADSIRTSRLPVEGNAWGPAAADVNGDQIDDLMVPDAASDVVHAFVSKGSRE